MQCFHRPLEFFLLGAGVHNQQVPHEGLQGVGQHGRRRGAPVAHTAYWSPRAPVRPLHLADPGTDHRVAARPQMHRPPSGKAAGAWRSVTMPSTFATRWYVARSTKGGCASALARLGPFVASFS